MERILELKLTVKKQKVFLVNDLYPSVIVLFTGITAMKSGTNIPLAVINILSGGILLAFGIREWRSLKKKAVEHHIQWFDVVSGSVMMIDAIIMYKPWKGFQPAWLYAVLSILIVLKGFSIVKPPRVRKLIITDETMSIRTGPFRKIRVMWNEVRTISMNAASIIVGTRDGEKSISLRSIENVDEIASSLSEACSEKQIQFQR